MNCRYCGNELNRASRHCPHYGFDSSARDLKSILEENVRLEGKEKLLDDQGLLNLLADIAPELKKEGNLLTYLFSVQGNRILFNACTESVAVLQNAVQKTASQIAEDFSVDPGKALEICGSDVNEEMIRYLIGVTINTTDEYNDRFFMLGKGLMSLDQFLEAM